MNENPPKELEEIINMVESNQIVAKKPNSMDKSKKNWLRSGIILFFFILVIILWIFRKKVKRNPFLPIPYVFNQKILNLIMKYLNNRISKFCVILYGPKGIGKARFLLEIQKKIKKPSVLINFENLSPFSSFKELSNEIINSLMESIKVYPVDGFPSSVKMQNCSNQFSWLQKEQGSLNFLLLAKNILQNSTKSPYVAIYSFLEFLNTYYKPILLLNNPSCLNEAIHKNESIKALLDYCNSAEQGKNKMPIIVTSTDLINSGYSFIAESYHIVSFEEFKESEARHALSKNEHVFSSKMLTRLYRKFGGYGYYYSRLYDLMRVSPNIDILLDSMDQDIINRVVKAAKHNATTDQLTERINYLKTLSRKGSLGLNQQKIETTQHFLKWGIIKHIDSVIHPESQIVTNCIKKALPLLLK